jgi:hypothetical protein
MRIRQQIHSALLLIIFASIACTIRMPENMAQYAPTPDGPLAAQPTAVKPTGIAVLANPAMTDTIDLAAPASEPGLAPPVVAIDPPVPAALADLTADSLIKEVALVSSMPVAAINDLQAKFYPSNNRLPAQFGVDRFRLHFRSRNDVGRWVSIRAELFVPRVDAPAEFPLFVYGAGTTGIGNE